MQLAKYLQDGGRGSFSKLAKDIKGHVSDVSDYAALKKPVPPARAVAIEKATKGAVSRKSLRPHDWQDLWPELGD